MFGRTTLQQAIHVNLKQEEVSLEKMGLTPLPNFWVAHNEQVGINDLFKLIRLRRKLKRDLLADGTMDRHLDHMLKSAINRDSICVGSFDPLRVGNVCGVPTPPPLKPIGLPFFTNAMEADEFYYPKHLRGHHFVTRVLPKDAVPIEDMDYKAIPFVIRENEEVQMRLRAERVKHGDAEYLRYIDSDTH